MSELGTIIATLEVAKSLIPTEPVVAEGAAHQIIAEVLPRIDTAIEELRAVEEEDFEEDSDEDAAKNLAWERECHQTERREFWKRCILAMIPLIGSRPSEEIVHPVRGYDVEVAAGFFLAAFDASFPAPGGEA